MPSTAPKTDLQKLLDEVEERNQKKSAKPSSPTAAPTATNKRAPQKEFDVDNNTFAKIVFSEASPEEKKEAIAKALVFDVSAPKEENQKRLKEFELFKEYLQQERQRMAQDIIDLTDTDAFAQMHEMFVEMNGAIVEFDSSMKPLTDILDAVYDLRMQGKEFTLDVFKEIQDDKNAAAERAKLLTEKTLALREMQAQVDSNKATIEGLKAQKKFLLFGGPKDPEKIAELNILEERAQAELAQQTQDLADLKAKPVAETKFAEFQEQKEKLRELLDISSDEHKERQKRLIAAAQNFVNTTETRGDQVLAHFGELGEHIDTLGDANRGIQSIYAIVTDASTAAAKMNKQERDKLTVAPENESTVAEMQRNNRKADIEEHISTADAAALDTIKTYAQLAQQGARILTMKDANRDQIAKARELTSSGVAGVAEGLSSVLTIVSAAALNESAELARNSVSIMQDRTDLQSQKESLRQAAGIADEADVLNKAVDSLKAYHDTSIVVAQTTKQNLEYVKQAEVGLRGLIEQTKDVINEQRGVQADAEMQSGGGAKGSFKKAADKTANDNAPAAKKPAAKSGDLKESPVAKLGRGGPKAS